MGWCSGSGRSLAGGRRRPTLCHWRPGGATHLRGRAARGTASRHIGSAGSAGSAHRGTLISHTGGSWSAHIGPGSAVIGSRPAHIRSGRSAHTRTAGSARVRTGHELSTTAAAAHRSAHVGTRSPAHVRTAPHRSAHVAGTTHVAGSTHIIGAGSAHEIIAGSWSSHAGSPHAGSGPAHVRAAHVRSGSPPIWAVVLRSARSLEVAPSARIGEVVAPKVVPGTSGVVERTAGVHSVESVLNRRYLEE